MSDYSEGRRITMPVSEEIERYRRTVLEASGKLALAEMTDRTFGIAWRKGFADGDYIPVDLAGGQGTHYRIASGAMAVNSIAYTAAAGKISDVAGVGAHPEGLVLTPANADGDLVTILPLAILEHLLTLTAGGAIDQYLRTTLTAGKLEIAGLTDRTLGVVMQDIDAEDDPALLLPANAPGPQPRIASKAIDIGDMTYTAAAGKISDVAGVDSYEEGIALTLAAADEDPIWVLPLATNHSGVT
ncbi:Hypothetical protein PBC10988_23140 [Planctomycetales bacterium 10988]|nr:Hypothetical protein PBC10988_23140 [Planctomycetales bacterium 10988]